MWVGWIGLSGVLAVGLIWSALAVSEMVPVGSW